MAHMMQVLHNYVLKNEKMYEAESYFTLKVYEKRLYRCF